ncbi:MAG: alpha/beta hydrolase [Bacteroidales bacterium]|nr:alpha/beta hydrolase [Bacteroidales bacterium]
MGLFSLLVAMALPFTTPAYEVTVERDVPYATAMGYWTHAPVGDKKALGKLLLHTLDPKPVTLEMDIYTPVGDDTAERPLLLMMHGGSFLFGNKEEPGQTGWCQYFASLGYVAVSINYRLGFHARKKEFREAELRALEDADAALEYLLGREDLRIDPERVFAAGTSAGAITALNLAFRLYGDKPMEKVSPRLPAGFHIRAVANLWGSVHDLSVLENAQAPILSFQSTADPVMPYDRGYPVGWAGKLFSDPMYGTHAVHEKALELGLRAEHHPCPEPRHRLHLDDALEYTQRFYEIRDAMVMFFAEEME